MYKRASRVTVTLLHTIHRLLHDINYFLWKLREILLREIRRKSKILRVGKLHVKIGQLLPDFGGNGIHLGDEAEQNMFFLFERNFLQGLRVGDETLQHADRECKVVLFLVVHLLME
ncbi:hypothetical protein N7462_001358 [Penicillium macrosclerotiorum]|uniref:uncharacterized protein n=1 Tax=Penicillium macrosclerotiorum TaxID=303699 RepID=UPI002547E58C|nr:uncharacterized protein N7462_001358 [Penicillium macrosclerotiorum]KAJ5691935.1 hypothetical protein N7462_001358 [Penicillium macrosclerotiorum]